MVMLFLLLSVAVGTSAELLIDHCGDECEQECDESCESCGDCIDCQRTMPMLVDDLFDGRNAYYNNAWLLSLADIKINDLFCCSIEHPPQLA